MAYTYDFNNTIKTLRGCLGAESYLARAMDVLAKNANVTLVGENAYSEYMAARADGEEPEGIETQPVDYPHEESFSEQSKYLKGLCQKRKGEAGMLLIRKDADSPAYGLKYNDDTHNFELSEQPLIPSAEKYAQQAENLKKPLPPAPNIFQKIGHFFSTLFGGEGNATVNRYNRALDENEAIIYNTMRDAGYKMEKSEAVSRWEALPEAARVQDAPQQENVVVHTHEKIPDDERIEARKETFINNLQKYTDKTDTFFVGEMTRNLREGSPEVQDYILSLDDKMLNMVCKFCRELPKKDPVALEQMLIRNAGIKKQQQNSKLPNDKLPRQLENDQPKLQSEPFVLKN